jgi:hypothetical protein
VPAELVSDNPTQLRIDGKPTLLRATPPRSCAWLWANHGW